MDIFLCNLIFLAGVGAQVFLFCCLSTADNKTFLSGVHHVSETKRHSEFNNTWFANSVLQYLLSVKRFSKGLEGTQQRQMTMLYP